VGPYQFALGNLLSVLQLHQMADDIGQKVAIATSNRQGEIIRHRDNSLAADILLILCNGRLTDERMDLRRPAPDFRHVRNRNAEKIHDDARWQGIAELLDELEFATAPRKNRP
jgi:hypothetical protein